MRRPALLPALSLAALLAQTALAADVRFAPARFLSRDAAASSIVVTDADHDGALDVVAALPDGIAVYYGDMRGNVRNVDRIAIAGAQRIALRDADGDGFPDIVATTGSGTWIASGAMNGFGAPVARRDRTADANSTGQSATADLNGDGLPDLVTIDGRSNALSIRLGQKDGTLGEERVVTLSDVPRAIAVADFDGDGNVDVATIDGASEEVSLMTGDGAGGFGAATRIATDGIPVAIAAGDIDRNGRIDLVLALEKGIEVLPNVTIPDRHVAGPGRAVHTDSLQTPRPNDFVCDFFLFRTMSGGDGGYLWNDPANWSNGLPGPTDTACFNNPTNLPAPLPVIVTGPAASAGAIGSNYPYGIQVGVNNGTNAGGTLILNNTTGSSTITNLILWENSELDSGHELLLDSISAFGGRISAFGPGIPNSDAIRVNNTASWFGTKVAVSGGDLDFLAGVNIAGRLPLCLGSTMLVRSGTVVNLQGLITNCGDGGTPLVQLSGNVNADVTGNGGIFTDLRTFQGSTITTTTTTGTGTFTINGGPQSALSSVHATIGAGTSLAVNSLLADALSTEGAGTLIIGGKVTGILTPINSALTVAGTLGHSPLDRGSFTVAGGPVTIQGNIDGHDLLIQNGTAGGTLRHACIENGGVIELRGTMSTQTGGFAQIGNCGGTPGEFRVNFFSGNLLVQEPLDVDSQTEFEADGAINVTSGPLRIFGSPLGHQNAGRFSITDGTSVQIFGPYTLNSASFTGGGTLDNEGTLHSLVSTIQNLTSSGNIDGPFHITQSMTWTGGTISSSGGGFQNGPVIQPGATLNVGSSFGAGTLNRAWLEIDGTANFTSLQLSNHATVNIGPGGVATGQSIRDSDFTGTLSENVNASLHFTAPASVSVSSVSLNSAVSVSGGTLQFFSPVSFGSFSTLDPSGGTVVFELGADFGQGFRSFYPGTVELTNHFYTGSPIFNGSVQFDPGASLDGGHVQIFGGATVNAITLGSSAETLSLYGGGTMPPAGVISANGGTIEIGSGFNMQGRGIFGNGFVHVLQHGNLFGGSAGGTTISPPLQNDGFIGADGGILSLQSVNNISGGTLTGGSWYANAGSTLSLPNVVTNTTSISANGTGARVSLGFPGLQTNAVNASLSVGNGGRIDGGSFTNLGTVSIGAGSTFNPISFTQTSGQTLLGDPTAVLSAQSGVPAVQAGILQGSGVVQPGLQNGGATIVAGFRDGSGYANPGTITVNGNYSETPAAVLHLFLVDETHASALHVTGSATLAGTIQLDNATFDDGFGDQSFFLPQPGDAFATLTYASHTGTFATILGQDLSSFIGPGWIFNPHYNANNLTFVVETLDPKVLVTNLETTIASFGLAAGTTQSLNSKLDAAHSALLRGDTTAACGQLGAALNFTNAQSGKSISSSEAQTIVSAIQQIQTKLGCR